MSARSPHAGTRPDASMLIDVDGVLAAYDDVSPDPADPAQRVSFGTSGHRGTATMDAIRDASVSLGVDPLEPLRGEPAG